MRELSEHGLLAGADATPELTATGRDYSERLLDARRALLVEALADDSVHRHPEVSELLQRLARELCGEPPVSAVAVASPA